MVDERRRVTVLGATGSIGRNTVDLLRRDPEAYEIVALTANRNVALLIEQARALRPKLAVVAEPAGFAELRDGLAGTGIEVAAGAEAVVEAAARDANWVMAAIVGAAGLIPTLTAVRRGAMIALANKECLVSAGAVILAEIERAGAVLLPVDSEHNAIFQVLDGDQRAMVERIILTASGGPFRKLDRAAMAAVTPAQAVAHPNWSMGAKISVDSATMMNKGLELIEAHHLFAMPEDRIEVLVHPQSVVHSLVGYADGSVLAQLGPPDMRTPIAHALGWPRRIKAPTSRLSLADIGTLTFEAPDLERFPALALAREALRMGCGAPNILNAANEVAVESFLSGRIGFLDIVRTVEHVLAQDRGRVPECMDDVFETDAAARDLARGFIGRIAT